MSSTTNAFKCDYDKQLEPGIEELLHFLIVSMNSALEKVGHSIHGKDRISSRKFKLICYWLAELKMEYSAYHKLSNSIHDLPLKTILSRIGSLYFLTQFISSQGFLFLNEISWILLLKNKWLVFLTIFLKSFQFNKDLMFQSTSSLDLQLLFHHSLEFLVICDQFACSLHILSEVEAKFLTILSNVCILPISAILILPTSTLRWLMKSFSSLLSLHMDRHFSWMIS